jgi:hypothetical protein
MVFSFDEMVIGMVAAFIPEDALLLSVMSLCRQRARDNVPPNQHL